MLQLYAVTALVQTQSVSRMLSDLQTFLPQNDANSCHVIGGMVGNSENYYLKGMLLCGTESSASDHSKYNKFHPWADLFTRTPNGLLWEAFSHAAINEPILSFHYTGE